MDMNRLAPSLPRHPRRSLAPWTRCTMLLPVPRRCEQEYPLRHPSSLRHSVKCSHQAGNIPTCAPRTSTSGTSVSRCFPPWSSSRVESDRTLGAPLLQARAITRYNLSCGRGRFIPFTHPFTHPFRSSPPFLYSLRSPPPFGLPCIPAFLSSARPRPSGGPCSCSCPWLCPRRHDEEA